MIDDFNDPTQQEDTTPNYNYLDTIKRLAKLAEYHEPKKPKGRKKLRKVLEKAERERNQLLYLIGQLASENKMMRRAIALAVAANRRQLDDDLAENTLRLLPPKQRGEGW